jgi:N4-gp56 family major capsid protein
MADAMTTFSGLSVDAPNVWIANEMYMLAERKLVVNQMAKMHNLPQRNSKTIRVVRYRRLSLPNVPLVEGVPPDSVALQLENVDVPVEQWGLVVLLTDMVQITTKHSALRIAIDRTAMAMAEMMEREACVVLLAGTRVLYAGSGNVARDGLLAADVVTSSLIIAGTVQLRALGAPDFGGMYRGAMAPQQEGDVVKETGASSFAFANLTAHTDIKPLRTANIGTWAGVDWVRGNFMPVFVGVAAADTDAATATKAQYTAQTGNGTLATGNYQLVVVAREIGTDYERKISVQTGNIAITGPTGSLAVNTPTSTNYVYDLYLTEVGATTAYKVASRVAANTVYTIQTAPAGTEATPPANPASGVSVFVGWIFGQDAFGRVELDGMSLQSYLTPAGASWSNPLAQGRKVGAKIAMKHFIIDNDFFVRFESGSSISDFLAA